MTPREAYQLLDKVFIREEEISENQVENMIMKSMKPDGTIDPKELGYQIFKFRMNL